MPIAEIVEIKSAQQRADFIHFLNTPDTLLELGPTVDIDFADVAMPLNVARCVSLTSVDAFHDVVSASRERTSPGADTTVRRAVVVGGRSPGLGLTPAVGPGRTPHLLGPVLRYGKSRTPEENFLNLICAPDGSGSDGVRISGVRLFGPSFGYQKTNEQGIHIAGCHDVEISNMEIAGWGGAAIEVDDAAAGPQSPQPANVMVLIHDNYLHDNQHPTGGGHAEGYGVNTGIGGWSKIYRNVFDNDRHSVTASGQAGGYEAVDNLVLSGGGYHGSWAETYIHSFDVHGDANCPQIDLGPFGNTDSIYNCGNAGRTFRIVDNTFQYLKAPDVKIRGKPKGYATIDGNIFARSDQGAAIERQTDTNTYIGTSNVYNQNDFGDYGVCDFDGDGIDDLFSATGKTWWFSSFGEFGWSYLNTKTERLKDVRLGYFDGDEKCDVLAEGPASGQWSISSGGTTDWVPLGNFGHPLSEVQFGRFDPSVTDDRPGATRQTTHAFWRRSDGSWFVTPLTHPDWKLIGSSSFPMSQLRFGDFTGHGRTDVLAVEDGHWEISENGAKPWRMLNPTLHDPVANLFIANMDADDNIDDILRLDRTVHDTPGMIGLLPVINETVTMTWWRSKNGTQPWQKWRSYSYAYTLDEEHWPVRFGFAGRFSAAPGGGTMIIDDLRRGQFFSAAERAVGANPDYSSLFAY